MVSGTGGLFVYMQAEGWDRPYPLSKISSLKPGKRGKRRWWFGAVPEEFPVYREWPARGERKYFEKREREREGGLQCSL